jgi:hypothetical protein
MRFQQSIELIALDDIIILPYQRGLNNAKVQRIAADFDGARLGVLVVSKHGPHEYAIIDGQHRLHALRQLGIQNAICVVVLGMTYEDEATYFRNQSVNTNPLNAFALYTAGVEAGDEHCLRIAGILTKNNYDVGTKSEPMVITAVNALSMIMRIHGEAALDLTLQYISAAWHGDPIALRREMLAGVAQFAYRFGEKVPVEQFVKRLGSHSPADLFFEYRSRAEGRINANSAFNPLYMNLLCAILRDHYNKGLNGNSRMRLSTEPKGGMEK